MDSLLANYASSDEEEEEEQQQQQEAKQKKGLSLPKPSSKSTSVASDSASKTPLFSSLPQANSSIFSSLPQRKSSLFSSLPPPTSKSETLADPPSSLPKPKRVVQFKPPIPQSALKSRDEDDDDEEDEERERKRRNQSVTQTPSVSSWLSAIPAPKHSQATLGSISSSGSGRRSIIEVGVDVPDTNSGKETVADRTVGNSESNWSHGSSGACQTPGNPESNCADGSSGTYQTVENFESSVDGSSSASLEQSSNWSGGGKSQQEYEGYGSYGNYGGYGHYENNWGNGSMAAQPEVAGVDTAVRVPGKRGRNEVPVDIVEVKQDELIKNRPREDQVKLTGIAFGPSYQVYDT